MSEEVRPSKKDKVWFYLLFANILRYFTQPRIILFVDPIFRMSPQRPNVILEVLLKYKGWCTIISIFITWVHLHFNTKWDPNFISTITPLRISRRKVDNNSENPSAKSFKRELTLAPCLCQPDIKRIDYLFSLWDWGAWVIKGLLYHPYGLPYKFTTITALVFKSSRQKTSLHNEWIKHYMPRVLVTLKKSRKKHTKLNKSSAIGNPVMNRWIMNVTKNCFGIASTCALVQVLQVNSLQLVSA